MLFVTYGVRLADHGRYNQYCYSDETNGDTVFRGVVVGENSVVVAGALVAEKFRRSKLVWRSSIAIGSLRMFPI